ncbi:P1 family peptidase [Micromonospora sp. 4G57]|uniref:P1 family peptidase n=1 Tax=Micromonospora sicca TaxID=2202420 RepID=A0ABU5JMR2_9ACTN|nr:MULTISPECIES: P1 family peptidase [unclassified Micromonospora]MDZ5446977.1 P1 family peptidase [Micromonospora sp. 4G57]MDZ5493654.1 P1 family peptidase [Micromonospora sp. 4G53]
MASRSAALLAGALVFAAATVATPGPAAAAGTPGLPGQHNAITDVPGVQVGQVQSTRAPYLTGSTVVYTPRMSVTGVDQAGGAPATKETDLLDPLNSNPGVNAVMLGGSSMYGLSAADGVIRWLEERGEGVGVGNGVAPIVPAADIFDLGRGGNFRARTAPGWGWLAAENAKAGAVAQGVVGGGTGARSGGLKGGVGTASMVLDNGIVVGAIVVVNSVGSPVDPRDCSLLAARYEVAGEFRGLQTPKKQECNPPGASGAKAEEPSMNTTIAVVATNAPLEKAAAARMASNAHDGLARAINPIHTLSDGDTVFAISTGDGTPLRVNADGGQLNRIFNAAADTLTRAVGHAILNATTVGTARSYCDRYPSACDALSPIPADKRGEAPEVTAESLATANGKISDGTPPVGGSAANGQSGRSNAPASEQKKSDESRQTVSFASTSSSAGSGPSPLLVNGLLALVGLVGLAGALLIRRRTAVRS